ncbi:Mobile element protein [Candidatus Enterovibrio escicola]|uniref:Mobile element protein n=1 Tax=Candidatus Enterovibrio escicola TaxID=1927127 RepID=A0A2A5T1M8_9GAMM|nr:Mobile element protein [Candidatus Enterovibrio escacola]
MMTIVIDFHQSGYQDFKTYHIHFVCHYLTNEFPELVSYTRMLKLMQGILIPLCSYLTHHQEKPTGIAFVDSSKLQVCHNLRILRYQIFKGTSKRGKGTMGWFYGDKGYISDPLEQELANKEVTLITGVKKHETQSDETLEPPNASETIYY